MLFSVVIPTYNRADLITKCLDSLVNQTFKDFEVIVCDNGSTDDTKHVVAAYASQLHLRYESLPGSGSPAHPRNVGMRLAKGEWICLLDSDDGWSSDKLLETSKHLANADVIYHALVKTDGERELGKIGSQLPFKNWEGFFIYGNGIPNSAACFRASLFARVGAIDESPELKAIEDADFWLRLMKSGARFEFIDKAMGFYYWKPGVNLTVFDDSYIRRNEALFNKYSNEFSNPKELKAAESLLALRRLQVFYRAGRWSDVSKVSISSLCALRGTKSKIQFVSALWLGRIRHLLIGCQSEQKR